MKSSGRIVLRIIELSAKHKRLLEEHSAWKLLKADNAPYILAFLTDIFSEDNEIAYGMARLKMEEFIKESRAQNFWSTEKSGSSYLREWIQAGWLREADDFLVKTNASEIALRFINSLDDRASGTSATHLRIVQDAVRDLNISLTRRAEDKRQLLLSQQAEIQREIDKIDHYGIVALTEDEKRERIREIYQLASLLTNDFRKVEEEIRILDKEIRTSMISGESHRGEILKAVLEQEEALFTKTEAGSAFDSFYQLLSDQNRLKEFRSQLTSILSGEISKYLSTKQYIYLNNLVRELSKEGARIFRVRSKTTESLRSFVENDSRTDNVVIARLLKQLNESLLNLTSSGIDLKQTTNLILSTGSPSIYSPLAIRLKQPNDRIIVEDIQQKDNINTVNSAVLSSLNAINIYELADKVRKILQEHGAMTIAQIINFEPISYGLEEIVAYIRLAKAIKVVDMNDTEILIVRDNESVIEVKIPQYLLSAESFPKKLCELNI